jgi:hypothetical protein
MREAVRGVAEHFPTAIVSGRGRDKVLHSSSTFQTLAEKRNAFFSSAHELLIH